MAVSNLGQELMNMYLKGQGAITQAPGPAAPSTRKYYSTHKGYDIGITPTDITPSYEGKLLSVWQDSTGYGTRAAVYNPKTNQTDVLSHLQSVYLKPGSSFGAGTAIGRTGGVPGTPGAGNTTGAHLDVERYAGQAYANMLNNLRPSVYGSSASHASSKVNVNDLLSNLREKNKSFRAVGTNQSEVEAYAKQHGLKVIRLS